MPNLQGRKKGFVRNLFYQNRKVQRAFDAGEIDGVHRQLWPNIKYGAPVRRMDLGVTTYTRGRRVYPKLSPIIRMH